MRLLWVFALAFLLPVSVMAQAQQSTTRLNLVLFSGGTPMADVSLEINDQTLGSTDEDGTFSAAIAVGEVHLVVRREGESLGELHLSVTVDQPVQVIGARDSKGVMSFDVEGASRGTAAGVAVNQDDAGQGRMRGRILSAEDGSPVNGAQIYLSGTDARGTTDAQGHFSVTLAAGDYDLSVVHPDFSTQMEEGIRVQAGQEHEYELELSPAGLRLADFTVTAPHVQGSVASVFSRQREGSGVSEVLGAEQMSRSGDSTAADALKRVTGLTIEDGKFVVVRGQPSRYTQTLWNGSPLPSPDPIRRIVPLDLFPTGALSAIEVEKSYDVAAPGSFGGGLIRLETAGVPEEDFAEISLSGGGNTLTTGQDGLDYQGGDDDLLGTDDGTRELPPGLGIDNTTAETTEAARGFTNIWALEDATIGTDAGIGLAAGKRVDALGGRLGLRGGLNWSRSFDYRETIKRDFAVGGDGALVVRNDQEETRTDMNVDIGGLFAAAMEWDRHALRSNIFLVRKAVKRSQITEGTRVVSDDLFIRDYLLEWNERELLAQQLVGEHDFHWVGLNWRGMQARAERSSPDRRNYIYRRQSNGEFVFFNQAKAGRRFNESEDDIASLDADLRFPLLDRGGFTLDLHTGVSTYKQDRESETRRFSFETMNNPDLSLPPEQLLDPANLGDTLEVSDETQTNDSYEGEARVDGRYVRLNLDLADHLQLVLGAREESSDFQVRTFVAGGSQGGQQVSGGFENDELLPAGSLTWRLPLNMQLRLSGSRTLSRPVLNELSPARYFDPENGEEYLGNPDLEPALIESLDVRWEWYPSPRESISLGFFNKDYTNPIEQSFVGVGGSSFLRQVQNAAGATVSGTEASARTDLTRLAAPLGLGGKWAENAYIQANAAFVDSRVELARQDLATNAERPLQGQADEVYNLQLGYEGERHDANLSWNLVGERLHLAGVQGLPDVFQQPVAQLDFNYTWSWTDAFSIKLSAGNLLDPEIEFTQGGELFRGYTKGVDFGASLKWKF